MHYVGTSCSPTCSSAVYVKLTHASAVQMPRTFACPEWQFQAIPNPRSIGHLNLSQRHDLMLLQRAMQTHESFSIVLGRTWHALAKHMQRCTTLLARSHLIDVSRRDPGGQMCSLSLDCRLSTTYQNAAEILIHMQKWTEFAVHLLMRSPTGLSASCKP